MTTPKIEHLPSALISYIEGLKTHDVDRIATTVAESLAFVSPTKTLDKQQFLAMLRAIYSAFPDWAYDHDRPEIREDGIAIRWRQGGTHTGTLSLPGIESISATGKSVQIPEQYFYYKIADGLIIEIRPEPVAGGAPGGIFAQIGVDPKTV
ncbi:MAG: ester cyclase [Gemmataceae bacterium]